MDLLAPREIEAPYIRDAEEAVFTGNVDLAGSGQGPGRASGAHSSWSRPSPTANTPSPWKTSGKSGLWPTRAGARLVVDGSRVAENAWYIQKHEAGQADRSIAEIVKQIAKTAHVFLFDGGQDAKTNTGGLITTDNPDDYEKFMNEVVVFEGLHTYGGMAGRTMEVLARGIVEMVDEAEVHWVMGQNERFTQRLRDGGVPLERGCDGAYLMADAFLPHLEENQQDTLAAALYLISGVRAVAPGLVGKDTLLPVQVPRLSMTNDQLDQVADAIIQPPHPGRPDQRTPDRIGGILAGPDGLPLGLPRSGHPLHSRRFPFEIHTIERVGVLTREDREKAMRAAGLQHLPPPLGRCGHRPPDRFGNHGHERGPVGGVSKESGPVPPPATSTSTSWTSLQDTFGYEYIIPTHQGRAAEHILSQTRIQPGPARPWEHVLHHHEAPSGDGRVGSSPTSSWMRPMTPRAISPGRGISTWRSWTALVQEHGAEKIAYVSFEHSVNMAGGQPVSMDNMKEVYEYCSAHSIPVFFDATRTVENAYMIQWKDPRYADTPVKDIVREMMLYGDGCTVSGKKDFLINIGGCLAFRDNAEWAREAEEMLRVYEGNVVDGGLAAADLAAIARGVKEMTDDRHIRARVQQTQYPGKAPPGRRNPHRHPPGDPRHLPGCQEVPLPPGPGRVPGPAPGGGDLHRVRGEDHGERERVQGDETRRRARTTGRPWSWSA